MEPDPSAPPSPAVRAQLLATEHWSLLASRSTAQGEVLTRITIHLTLVSAGLVTLGLLGRAVPSVGGFPVAAIGVLAFLVLVGLMTQIRVGSVADQDMQYVIAMNRLRAAYVDLDPGVERYFLAASHDDEAGMRRTYSLILVEGVSHVFGSSFMLVFTVNGLLVGLLGASVVSVAGGAALLATVVGVVLGAGFVGGSLLWGIRHYDRTWRTYRPIRPHSPSDAGASGSAPGNDAE
ncbi:MAG TPA: hypothetical protein VGC94_02875 [Amnibacterium sp.]|jgi:hypothetical protein